MKKQLTVLLFLFPLIGLCQTETEVRAGGKVGIVFTQDFYRSAEISTSNYSGYFLEPVDFNYTTGIKGSFSIRHNLNIASGITYSQKDFTAYYYCEVCRFSEMPPPVSIEQVYLEVPVLLQYQVLKTKLGLYTETGILNGYRISSTESEADKAIYGSDYLLSGQIGLGVSYTVGQRLSLNLNAVYKRSLEDFSSQPDLKLNSVGVGAGIMYSLN